MFQNRIIFPLLMMVVALFAMTSCSEDDNTIEEFSDWKSKNELFFNNMSDSIQQLIKSGRTDWKRIRVWSKNEAAATQNSDFILMQILDSASTPKNSYPLFTDTAFIHFKGRLIPSISYKNGFTFSSSYSEPFDINVAVPVKFAVNRGNNSDGLVEGVSTALMNMRKGDVCNIYIPYQLGYGEIDNDPIPAYSTLIFNIILSDFKNN